MNPDNARTFRITAAAGTELAGPYSYGTRKGRHVEEFGPCLSPNVGDSPLRAPTDRRHGGPLPRRPANRTHPHPFPNRSFRRALMPSHDRIRH